MRLSSVGLTCALVALAACALFACASAWKIERKDLLCSACQVTAQRFLDEMEAQAKKNGKTFVVGSRLKDKGYDKKPYTGSISHVLDALEHTCKFPKEYAVLKSPLGIKKYMEMGGAVQTDGTISLKPIDQFNLKHTCQAIVEKHEDDFRGAYRHYKREDFVFKFCNRIVGICSYTSFLEVPMDDDDDKNTQQQQQQQQQNIQFDSNGAFSIPTPSEDGEAAAPQATTEGHAEAQTHLASEVNATEAPGNSGAPREEL